MSYEKDQHPTAKIARILCWAIIAIATLGALVLYGTMFDHMSEDDLVQISFLWICAIGFGAGGLLLAHRGLLAALGIGAVIALGFFLALETFYQMVWPSL